MQFKLTASEWLRDKQHVYLMQVADGMSRCPKRLSDLNLNRAVGILNTVTNPVVALLLSARSFIQL